MLRSAAAASQFILDATDTVVDNNAHILLLLLLLLLQGQPPPETLMFVAWECGGVTTGPVTVPVLLQHNYSKPCCCCCCCCCCCRGNRHLQPLMGVAWDCGGVTTGPVTVPVLLSLGVGVMKAQKQKQMAQAVLENAALKQGEGRWHRLALPCEAGVDGSGVSPWSSASSNADELAVASCAGWAMAISPAASSWFCWG
jgi:hypothetical protein